MFWVGTFFEIGTTLIGMIRSGFNLDIQLYSSNLLLLAMKIVVPIIGITVIATALPSFFQSGFTFATDLIKFDLGNINPIEGLKKIFSLRTVKELCKAILYLAAFSAAITLTVWWYGGLIYSQVNAPITVIIKIWSQLLLKTVIIFLSCILFILLLDFVSEFFLYFKNLRMDKEEVKREYKETEGDPLLKNMRKHTHLEILNSQDRYDIENSRLIIANPYHIAIGIYFKPEISPIPIVSLRECNQRAQAVRHYAEKIGIPVVLDIPFARRLYRTHKRYEMISMREIHQLIRLLVWLQQVEKAGDQHLTDHIQAVKENDFSNTNDDSYKK